MTAAKADRFVLDGALYVRVGAPLLDPAWLRAEMMRTKGVGMAAVKAALDAFDKWSRQYWRGPEEEKPEPQRPWYATETVEKG